MRRFVFIVAGLAFEMAALGQASPELGPPHKVPKDGYDRDCVHRNKYTEAQRLAFFPFNVSDSIKLVSFRYHDNYYPVGNDHITHDSLIEQRLLTKSEVNQLTDLIYNMGPKKEHHIVYTTDCFWPRNAVLFIDRKGKLQAYMLICFHCRHFEKSADNMWSWDNCDQKAEMIHQFFISAGIKFGTDLTIEEYQGEE